VESGASESATNLPDGSQIPVEHDIDVINNTAKMTLFMIPLTTP
jgi:hypothetical protein